VGAVARDRQHAGRLRARMVAHTDESRPRLAKRYGDLHRNAWRGSSSSWRAHCYSGGAETIRGSWPRGVLLTALLWVMRYGLLRLDVSGRLFPEGIFDPLLYASAFGDGLAKSIVTLPLPLPRSPSTFTCSPARRMNDPWRPGRTHAVGVPCRGRDPSWPRLLRSATDVRAAVRSILYDSTLTIAIRRFSCRRCRWGS